jgi:tetratricopeptide (TPR) repeat protein
VYHAPVQCLDERAVLAFVAGDLDPASRDRSEAHLDGCPHCLALVAELAKSAIGAGASDRERYELGEEIARGGMGTVYAAHDRVLDRKVAVKVMRAGAPVPGSPSLSTGLARRFAREVMLTARLQHPAIVPVYDAGTFEDGSPFYAMRMVAGRTLDRAAEGGLADRLGLLPSVLAVAEAIAYAHSEGVVHRDLKPQNVLVGRFGETVLLDWGLAKDLRRDPPDERAAPIDASEIAGQTTRAGEVVGTLGYMPPERMAGDPGGERGDVYGLGAILYHVLAGGMPRRSAGEEPEPLAWRQDDVPRELEAIVARAMAADPAARYPSAAELAEDLRRFQTGRLVAAHRYSRRELVRRWIARHRAVVAVAALAVLGVAVVTGLSFRRVVGERELAEGERRRAETERGAAEELVGFILGDLRDRLETIGRLDALAGAGRSVDAYFARVPVRGGPGGERDLLRRGQALSLLGDAAMAAGDLEGAGGYYQRSLDILKSGVDGEEVCRSYLRSGDLARARGDLERAMELARSCERLAADRDSAAWLTLRAQALCDQGKTERMRGEFSASRRLLDRATAAVAELTRAIEAGGKMPKGTSLLMVRVVVQDNLVVLGFETGDIALARRAGEENRAALEVYRAAHPDDPDAERQLGVARTQLGTAYLRAGELKAAAAEFEAARAAGERLVARDPSNVDWRRDLSIALARLAETELGRGEGQRALGFQQKSRDLTRGLAELQPQNQNLQRDLLVDELSVAQIQQELGRLDDAAATVRRAVATAERLHDPARPLTADDLSVVLLHQAAIDIARKKPALAAPALARSLELRRAGLAAEDTPMSRIRLAETLMVHLDLPAPAAPCALLAESRQVLDPVAGNAASDAVFASLLEDLARAEKKHRCRR